MSGMFSFLHCLLRGAKTAARAAFLYYTENIYPSYRRPIRLLQDPRIAPLKLTRLLGGGKTVLQKSLEQQNMWLVSSTTLPRPESSS